jgi:hypothetical protein
MSQEAVDMAYSTGRRKTQYTGLNILDLVPPKLIAPTASRDKQTFRFVVSSVRKRVQSSDNDFVHGT